MIQGFYTASGSMIAQQGKINVIAGNIANVNTSGYKRNDVSFSEVVYSAYQNQGTAGAGASYRIGNGVMVSALERDLAPGVLLNTTSALDLGIDGDGFFTLGDGAGNVFYSRGGSFHLSEEGGNCYIADSNGYYLLDENMQPISAGAGDFTVASDGLVISDGAVRGRMRIVGFEYPGNLESLGGGLYAAGEDAGGETEPGEAIVRQRTLESSNVDLATEMTELISTQRLYQINSKLIQVIDEMQGMANALRK